MDEKKRREERRSGATGTGVSLKDLQLGNTNNEKRVRKVSWKKGTRIASLNMGAA